MRVRVRIVARDRKRAIGAQVVRIGRAVFANPAAVSSAAAALVIDAAQRACRERGAFRLALSGGSTPVLLYRELASSAIRDVVPWDLATFLFVDERAVPRGHADRNDRLADEHLFGPLGIAERRILRMRAEAPDLEAAAAEYETHLAEPIDLALLGVGPDGHIASIFPGSVVAREDERRCVAVVDSPKPPPRRLTLTPRALRETRAALVIVTGNEKAAAVAAAFDDRSTPLTCPASLLREREWILDVAAAADLHHPGIRADS